MECRKVTRTVENEASLRFENAIERGVACNRLRQLDLDAVRLRISRPKGSFSGLSMYHFHKIAFVFLVLPMSLLAQSTPVGGPVTNNTTWSPAMGTILVYSNVIVSAGATLTIQAGTAVRITNGLSISALAGSRIDAEGSPTNPITFLPMVGVNKWGT